MPDATPVLLVPTNAPFVTATTNICTGAIAMMLSAAHFAAMGDFMYDAHQDHAIGAGHVSNCSAVFMRDLVVYYWPISPATYLPRGDTGCANPYMDLLVARRPDLPTHLERFLGSLLLSQHYYFPSLVNHK